MRWSRPDAGWATFIPTPPFPSYPSGHAAFGAAARHVLERQLGPDGHAITLASPRIPDVVRVGRYVLGRWLRPVSRHAGAAGRSSPSPGGGVDS